MSDRTPRQYPRFQVALAAEVTMGFETVEAATQNISEGGVALALDASLAEGTEVDLTLILTQDGIEDPFEEPFECKASVAWARPGEGGGHLLGMQFLSPAPAQRQRLERFIGLLEG